MGWSFDAPVVLGVLMAGGLYASGVRRLGNTGSRQRVARWRTAAFGAGLLLIVIALESPLDGWADRLLLSLAVAMYPWMAEAVPDFGQGCPHRWPRESPTPGLD